MKNDNLEVKKSKMGKGEKIFWLTIVLFALLWLILQGFAYINNQKYTLPKGDDKPILKTITKTIVNIVDDNKSIRKNLENTKTMELLNENLNLRISNLNRSIEEKVNLAFSPVYNNIDTFLDFHYSVVGEYTELVGAATDKLGETIKEKLFTETFNSHLDNVQKHVSSQYSQALKEHYIEIDTLAKKDINKTLNSKIFEKLNQDVEQRISIQAIKIGSIIGTATAIKIIGVVSAKIVAKTMSKVAAKSAIKTSAKIAASGSAAATGLSCGPLAWVCSPVAATAAWFGTDAIIISADEYMNRDEFRQDITAMLDKEKQNIIRSLQTTYTDQFKKDSQSIQDDLKKTVIKKKVTKTIKERIFE